MTDYKAYQEHVGITNPEMTEALQKVYPSYNKVCGTYVNNPKKYGVCLLPAAERLLLATFGPGPGLESLPWQEKKKKKSDKRRKGNAVTVRMTDELYQFAQAAKQEACCESMQALFEYLLIAYVKGRALLSDDPDAMEYLRRNGLMFR